MPAPSLGGEGGVSVACAPVSGAISRRRGGTRRGAFLAGCDAQALDPARIGIEHLDFEIAGAGNDFAAHRQPPDMGDKVSAQRFHFLAGFAGHKILADHGADVVEAGARVGDEGIIRLLDDRRRLVAVVLVVDLADDLLDDILDRDEAVGAAIFVDHQRQMNARGLHLRQQVDRAHRRRHIEQFADDVGLAQRKREIDRAQVEAGGHRLLALGGAGLGDTRLRRHERQQIADVNDAFRIVQRLVVDHEARMRRALEQAHQLAERDIALDRDDVGAMHHHVGDAALVQAEDVAQHGALDGGKADLVRRRGVEHDLQVVAHRAWLPSEQRADRAAQPVVGSGTQHLAFLHHCGEVAGVLRIVMGRVGIRHRHRS